MQQVEAVHAAVTVAIKIARRDLIARDYAKAHNATLMWIRSLPGGPRLTMAFGEFLEKQWSPTRKNRNADNERGLVERYFLSRDWLARLPCEELRPRHSVRLVEELKATVSEQTGRPLAEHYVSNLYGLYCTAVRDARLAELVLGNPCVLPRGLLSRKYRKGTRLPYPLADVVALTSRRDEASVFAALALLTGMREGEACGRRWRDWDRASAPLGCLDVRTQYNDQPLKTDRGGGEHARKVPVHPWLGYLLDWWWCEGFEFTNCRPPTLDDFIIPRRQHGKVAHLVHHTKKTGGTLWERACDAAGVKNLSLHSSRHTFITLARRGGARVEVVERITHNAAGTIVDHYTHWDWEPLCQAVLAIQLPEPVAKKCCHSRREPGFRREKWVEALGIEP
jgi:integrase